MSIRELCPGTNHIHLENNPQQVLCTEIERLAKEVNALSKIIKQMETECQERKNNEPNLKKVCDCSKLIKELQKPSNLPRVSDR